YPWGSEAFEKAKQLGRPIFLSVGYSTCHWCHVMEKESFENEEIARQLNKDFICIKVDREERPDVDKLYMAFIQATTGSGGWPMTVFLTPELDPITGGTYFPPRDSLGSLGLPSVLKIVSEKWNNERSRKAIGEHGQKITDAMKSGATYAHGDSPPFDTVANGAFQYKVSSFDEIYGGFGQDSEREICRHMLDATLDGMNKGGIHDHIGKGFHRYSVDEEWHVPHFEKMLYDQSQLLSSFGNKFNGVVAGYPPTTMERCLSTRVESESEHGRTTLQFEENNEGGFYAAEDADSLPTGNASEKKEGAFCVWEMSEISELLKDLKIEDKDAVNLFCRYYDVHEKGNVSRSKLILAEARSKRPAPHLDSKMVCSWQGLAISGFVKASIALACQDYLERAKKTVDFVKRYLMDEKGQLLRAAYRGDDGNVETTSTPTHAFSDDYAFLIQGLLDLYQATAAVQYLEMAERLQNEMDSLFWDSENESGYYIASEQADVKVRVMEDQDGAEPCANSVAVGNLVRLFDILDIVVVGEASNEIVKSFQKEINAHYIWNSLVVSLDPSVDNSYFTERSPVYAEMLKRGEPTVFICSNFTCGPPITSVDELKEAVKRLVE
ncbi:hypothetical protein OSTOST_03541, partial [Ostertagia ostertagi]